MMGSLSLARPVARDKPWGLPGESVNGEPITPEFATADEMKHWAAGLSREEQGLAKARCMDDRAYFINNFCFFRAKPEDERMAAVLPVGWIQFRLWPAQLRVLREIGPWSRILAIKVRQIGLTWLFACCGLHATIFKPDTQGFIFSYDQKLANKLMRRLTETWKRLPDFLVRYTAEPGELWTADYKEFTNGSSIEAFPATEAASLGDAYDWGIFDEIPVTEALRKKDLTEMVNSAMLEALRSHQGWFAGLGTGRWRAGWAWKMVQMLHYEGKQRAAPASWHDWRLVFIPISDHPYWTQARIDAELENHPDPLRFWREHPRTLDDAFAVGGDSVFSGVHLNRRVQKIVRGELPRARHVTFKGAEARRDWQPAEVEEGLNEACVYEAPVVGRVYAVGLDTTRQAASKDYCGGIVLDAKSGMVSAVVHWKFNDPYEFADYAIALGMYYNQALLIPEVNVDRGLAKRLVARGYWNLYRRRKTGERHSPVDVPEEDLVGWVTSPGGGTQSRSEMLAQLKWEVTHDWLQIPHLGILNEMSTFIVTVSPDGKREKEEAASGAHDDLLMPLAIVVRVVRNQPEHLPAQVDEGPGGIDLEAVKGEMGGKRALAVVGSGMLPWGFEDSAGTAAGHDMMEGLFRHEPQAQTWPAAGGGWRGLDLDS